MSESLETKKEDVNEQKISPIQASSYFKENETTNKWKCHGAYLIIYYTIRFFRPPPKVKSKRDLDIVDHTSLLLETVPSNNKTVELCLKLIRLHRHVENTSARKRLEHWAKIVITTYLLSVFFLLIIDGGLFKGIGLELDISDQVMITILSTTTINIIGIGLIVLKGHFPKYELESKDPHFTEEESDAEKR